MASRFSIFSYRTYKSVNYSTTARTFSPASRSFARLNQIQFHTNTGRMGETSTYRANGDNGDAGDTEGELNAWKHRAPYRVHENPDFHVRYEASCHCGKIKYQLSREKPLDSKYCHCHTCQKLHGRCTPSRPAYMIVNDSRSF